MNTVQKHPYIGPRTFLKEEGYLFFGREREARDLLALVVSERLVLFYAQSGAGKSSLINTCLIPNLESKDFQVLPVARVSGDLQLGLKADNIFTYNLMHNLVQHETDPISLAEISSLSEFLARLNIDEKGYFYDDSPLQNMVEGEVYTPQRRILIIDQFEELFSTHPDAWGKREGFFRQLAQAMDDDPYLWVVLVMREDYIAVMDPYAYLLSGGLRTRYYMQRLSRESALNAVKKPVESLRPFADEVAEKLVEDLCSIKVQKPDGTLDNQPGQYVEPVQLQVVCYGLWENLSPEGNQITDKDLQDVGDVNQSLGKYYEGRVNAVANTKDIKERLIREWFEKKLITTGGIRNMVLQERDRKSSGIADEVIQALQSDLVRAEKRGGATWYELTHDRLVEPILESNKKWFNENLSPLQRQTALWKDQDQNESWLLRDNALVEIEEWAKGHQDELTDTEKEFLKACQKMQVQIVERKAVERHELEMANKLAVEQARSAAKAKRYNFFAAGLVIVAILAAIWAFTEKNNADLQAAKAKEAQDIAQSSELSTIALDRSDSQLDLALLLGVEADSINSNSHTQKALLTLLQKSGRYRGTIKGEDEIQEIQYSPDGRTFASRDKNGIIFWNADTLQPLNDIPLNGHFNGVTALAISKDGKFIASGATDGTIIIWDSNKRQPLSKPFKAHNGQISSLAFSMDGNTLASAGGSEIILWDITDPVSPQQIGETLSNYSGNINSVAFSPDGTTLASGSDDYSVILWNIETHEPIGEPLIGHSGGVRSVAFSSDRKTLASGSYDNTVILWDVSDPENPKQIGDPLAGHTNYIYVIAISPNGKILASGDDSGNIILWDIQTGKSIGKPFTGWVTSLSFSPDSKTLASGSRDQSGVILWDVEKQTQIGQPLLDHNNSVSGLVFSPDGTLISASMDSTIIFWDVSKLKSPQKIGDPLNGHPGQPTSMSFSPDGSLLESYGEDGTFLLDVKTQKQIGIGSRGFLTSPDKSIIAYQTLNTTTDENTIHLMKAETSETIGAPISGENPIFSPDSKNLVFQTYDKEGQSQLHLWNITTNKEVFLKSGECLGFSPNSQILLYRTTDQDTGQIFINLWDITAAKNIGKDIEGFYPIISSDSQILVYRTTDWYTLNLWDIKTAKNIGGVIDGSYLSLSSNHKILLYQTIRNGETSVVVWDIAKAVEIKTIASNNYLMSQDGNVLAFVTYDVITGNPFINLLDTATGDSLMQPVEVDGVSVSINSLSANGKIMLYSSSDDSGISSIKALNTNTGEMLNSIEDVSINRTIELSQALAYEFNDNNGEPSILLINPVDGLKIGELIKGSIQDLIQDGEILVYQDPDGKLNLLYTNDPYGSTVLEGSYLDIASDSKILIYQIFENNSNNIKLWDLTTNKNMGEPIKGTYLAVSSDGKTLVTYNETNVAIFWDITRTWPFGDPVIEKTDMISSIALSADGKTLAFSDASGISLQDTISGKIIRTFSNDHIGMVDDVVLSSDEQTLLSIGEDGKTIAWDLNTFRPLSDPITGTTAFFSPSGKFIGIVDSIENTTTLWDLTSQKVVGEPFTGQNITFSPDEKFVAIKDEIKNTITLWNLTTQQAVGEPFTGQSFTFSPDSKTLALIDGNATTLWDLTTLEIIDESFTGQSVIFSPDSKTLAVFDGNSNTTTLFDLFSRQIVNKPIQGYIVTSTEISSFLTGTVLITSPEISNTFIIASAAQNTTTFWEWETRNPLDKPIDGSDVSFIGTKLNVMVVHDTVNNTITLWNPVTRAQIGKALPGVFDSVFTSQYGSFDETENFISICADNKTVAWFDVTNTTAVFWDLEKDQSLGEIKLGEQSTDDGVRITFNPSCDVVALGDISENKIILWDLKINASIGELVEGSAAIFSPDGSTILVYSGNVDNLIATTFWNVADATQIDIEVQGAYVFVNPENSNIVEIIDENEITRSITYTIWDLNSHLQIGNKQDGFILPMSNRLWVHLYIERGATLWDIDTNTMVGQPFQGHSSLITNMQFSPDGSILASLASDGIVLTDMDKKSNTHLVSGDYPGQFNGIMAFSSDGKSLTALGSDGTIFSWDIASDPPIFHDPLDAPYKDFIDNVYRLTLSPDGKYLIYEYNSKLNIWDIGNEKLVREPTEIKNSSGGAITFSPDGKSMFYNDGGTIFQWDEWNNPDKNPRNGISFEKNPFSSLNMIMDSANLSTPKYLLSTSGGAVTQIWDWNKNSKVGDSISGYLQVIGSNAQTQVLIYKDSDGRLIKWDMRPDTWKKFLCQKVGRNLTMEEWDQYIGEAPPYQAVCSDLPFEQQITSTPSPTP